MCFLFVWGCCVGFPDTYPPLYPYPLLPTPTHTYTPQPTPTPTPTPLSPLQTSESFNQQAAGHDALIDPDEADQASTRNLMAAVSSLPELTEKKRIMDKHTELATALLGVRGVGVRGWV